MIKDNITKLASQVPPNIIINTTIIMTEVTRRDFLKISTVGAISTWIASCLPLGETPQTHEPLPTFGVDMYGLYPDKSLFKSERLLGKIVTVEDVPRDDLEKYRKGVELAAVKEGVNTSDPNMDTGLFGLRMTDNAGTVRENIFMIRQPKPIEDLGPTKQTGSALYFYSGINGINFVSPDEALDKSIGRLFPVVHAIDTRNGTLHAGLGRQIQPTKYLFTIGLFDMDTTSGDVRYQDPYSGSTVELPSNEVPEGMGKGFASLVPVEILAESQLPPEMTDKYKNQFETFEYGVKQVDGINTNVIYGIKSDETKKVIAMNIEVDGEMRMTGVSETTVYDKENNSHDIYVYIDPNWSASDDDDPRGPDEKRGRVTVTEATAAMLFGKPENPDTPVFWNALAQQMGLSVDKTIDLVMRENNGITNFKVPVGERQKITFNSDMTKLPYPANLNKPIAIKVIFSKDDYNRLPEEIKGKRSVITYEREDEEYGLFDGRLLWTEPDGEIVVYAITTGYEVYFGLDPNRYGKDGPSLSIDAQKAVSKLTYSLFDLIGDSKQNNIKYYGDSVPRAFDVDLVNFK